MAPCAPTHYTDWPEPVVKRVRFCEHTEIATRESFSKQETQKCWYTTKDYYRIGMERKQTLRRVLVDGEHGKWCMRGLERFRSSRHKRMYKQEQHAVLQAVLYEQERQRTLGITDSGLICHVASSLSHGALQRALNLAKRDRMDGGSGWYESGLLFLNQSLLKSEKMRINEGRERTESSMSLDQVVPMSA